MDEGGSKRSRALHDHVRPVCTARRLPRARRCGKVLLHFEADWSPNVHLLADSRCLRRVQDQNAPFDKDHVKALKEAKAQGLFERTFPAGARMDDLDEALLARFAELDASGDVRATLSRYPPRFDAIGGAMVQVTLRNEPIYDRATLEWLKQFAEVELTGDQKRMLAYAHAHGDQFTSREYQRVVETDIYGASNSIKDMIRKGVARSTGKGSRVYEVKETLKPHPAAPEALVAIIPLLQRRGCVSNADVRRIGNVARNTAARILSELVAAEWLVFYGKKGLGARYYPGNRLLHHSPIARESRETGAMGPETGAMEQEK